MAGTGSNGRGHQQARNVADAAFTELVTVLRPFVEGRFRDFYGPEWRTTLKLLERSGIGAGPADPLDDHKTLLEQLANGELWQKVFVPSLVSHNGAHTFGLAKELLSLRHVHAHRSPPWTAFDTLHVVEWSRLLYQNFGLMTGSTTDVLDRLERDAAALVAADRGPDLERARVEYLESVTVQTDGVIFGGSALAGASPDTVPLADRYVPIRFERVSTPDRSTRAGNASDRAVRELGLASPRVTWRRLNAMGRSREDVREQHDALAGSEDEGVAEPDVLLRRRVILLGEPGSGKSTFLAHLAGHLAIGGQRLSHELALPIQVRAADLGRSVVEGPTLSLRRYLVEHLTERYGELLAHEIDQGRAVILIDSLDEIDEPIEDQVVGAIARFAAEYPAVSMIVTSRSGGARLSALGSEFVRFQLRPLGRREIESLAKLRVGETSGAAGDPASFVEALADSGLDRLAGNPLLITIAARLWQPGSPIPLDRLALYAEWIGSVVRARAPRRKGTQSDADVIIRALERAAHHLIAGGHDAIGEGELIGVIFGADDSGPGAAPNDGEARVSDLVMRGRQSGILVDQGHIRGEPQYGFSHRSFAEYLAARWLADQWRSRALDIRGYLHRRRWSGTVRFAYAVLASGGPEVANQAIRELLDFSWPAEEYVHGNLRLALQLLGDGIVVRSDLRDEIVRRAFSAYLDPGNEPFRIELGRAIVEARSGQPLPLAEHLARASLDEDPVVAAKKARLQLLFEPHAPEHLRAVMSDIEALLGHSRDPRLDIEEILNIVGASTRFWDRLGITYNDDQNPRDMRYRFWAGRIATTMDSSSAKMLVEAGVPVFTAIDARDTPAADWPPRGPSLLDRSSVDDLSLADVLTLSEPLRLHDDVSEAWLDAHADEMAALARDPRDLGPAAARCASTWRSRGATNATLLLVGLVLKGQAATQREALWQFITDIDEDWSESDFVPLLDWVSRQSDPELRIVVAAAFAFSGDNSHHKVAEFVQALAMKDSDPSVRGAARRAILTVPSHVGEPNHEGSPMRLLSGPEIAVQSPYPSWLDDATASLAEVIIGLDTADRTPGERAILESALRAILTTAEAPSEPDGSDDYLELKWGFHPAFERIAKELAASPRSETRAWAAVLIARLERYDSAAETLESMIRDEVELARVWALEAIAPPDLIDTEWLERELVSVLDHAPIDSIETLGRRLRAHCSDAQRKDLGEFAEAYLTEHRDSRGGRVLAALLLL